MGIGQTIAKQSGRLLAMPKSRHRKKKSRVQRSSRDERIAVIRRIAHYPLRECRINEDWKESHMANIIFARNRPDSGVAIASFVVDLGCLGVKDAFANPDIMLSQYARLMQENPNPQVIFDPDCAVKLILGAIEYAKALDFKPHSDYYYSREIFGDLDANACAETFEYGRDGKPFYVAGPYDNARKIVNHLARRLGAGEFDYVVSEPEDDFFEDDEDDEDEDYLIEN
jgi:hypothetical protein